MDIYFVRISLMLLVRCALLRYISLRDYFDSIRTPAVALLLLPLST